MAIPDFQSLMLPLLRQLADGAQHRAADVVAALAGEFRLSPEEMAEQLPSGRANKFANRVHWARQFLKSAGLVENPARGFFRITDRGREELRSPPERISIRYLYRYPEFAEWRSRSAEAAAQGNGSAVTEEPEGSDLTPQEQIEAAHVQLQVTLTAEILERVKAAEPVFFERLVVRLLVAMGYGGSQADAGRVVGQSGDGGIDGVIAEDRLGLDSIYIQAKRWEAPVGAGAVRDFLGAMLTKGATKGVFFTTSRFAAPARAAAAASPQHKVILIDGERLAQLLVEHGLGVSTIGSYAIKRLDSDFFVEE